MERRIKTYTLIAAIGLFLLLPILFYAMGDFPRRSFLKEVVSLATIIAFFSMLLQFYLSRANKSLLKEFKIGRVNKWHKALGYIFVSILLLHPFLIVVPRFLEAGISPIDAFKKLLTTFSSEGIILGMTAWGLMVILGLTSLLRNKLGLAYKTWRDFHGILSILFIGIASFHVINLGRHINAHMTWLIAALSGVGITILLVVYFFKPKPINHE